METSFLSMFLKNKKHLVTMPSQGHEELSHQIDVYPFLFAIGHSSPDSSYTISELSNVGNVEVIGLSFPFKKHIF